MVAVGQRAREQLVRVAGELEGAHRALQLGADAALGRRREAARRDLLAGVDRLRRDQVEDLVGVRDRARHDTAPDELGLDEHALARDVGAGGARRDVGLGDEDRHVRLVLADVALVVRHVKARQERRDESQRDCDRDVPDAVRHERLFPSRFGRRLRGAIPLVVVPAAHSIRSVVALLTRPEATTKPRRLTSYG